MPAPLPDRLPPAPEHPPPARRSRDRATPLAVVVAGVLGLAGLLLLAGADPSVPGRYPPCPVHAATGLLCPGCGGLRAGHALTRGDLPAALRANAVVPLLALAALLLAPLRALRRRHRLPGRRDPGTVPRRPAPTPRLLLLIGVGALAVFTVLRNLPVGAFPAP
ncbi:hypothetical protein GCM10027160_18140 [Streptomyces calidiresistens]|uniref:DUF2752 domain-containing protein n=1 Tax=Streptomyces calidiresistens TaxID=1485586 RepID=UPI002B200A72|nr:DUF2752 domain-containing protein [Streptomyces calidiresistens]